MCVPFKASFNGKGQVRADCRGLFDRTSFSFEAECDRESDAKLEEEGWQIKNEVDMRGSGMG